uniref:Golgin subfamily A member 4-like n=1 Tax=Elaeophora elaphi TaxID=1147741 RepID=A0A0R3RZI6_9BILA
MEEKVRVKKRNASGIVPWEPCKAAISAYAKGSHPGVLPPLIKYQFVEPNPVVLKNKAKLEVPERHFSQKVESGEVEICDLSQVRSVGDGKESSPLSGNVEVGKEGNADNLEELKRLRKDLELERQLTQELKRILVATMGDDLTCHVKSLSEDKVRLAHMMTKFEAQISHDHDRAEDLAILADMWRCKFLAMSIRADEMRSQRCRLFSYCKQLQILLNKFLVTNEDHIYKKPKSPILEALINEARALLKTDLSTFFERSPCDEKICKPVPHTSNITITCCKHCVGKEIKLI